MFWRWHAVQCKSMSYGQEGAPCFAISGLVLSIIIACFTHFKLRVLGVTIVVRFAFGWCWYLCLYFQWRCVSSETSWQLRPERRRASHSVASSLTLLASLFYDVTSSVLNLFYLCTVVNVYFCLLCRDLQGNNLTSVRRRDLQGLRNLRILWVALSHKTFAYHVPLLQQKHSIQNK